MTKMPSYSKSPSLVPPLKMNGKDVSNGLDYKEMRNDLISKFSITAPRGNNSNASA
jgi:hypothetical protein